MKDQFGRRIDYLRIPVTDKCNFRSACCMRVEGLPWNPKVDLVTYEEIAEIVRQMADLGLRRVRITGVSRSFAATFRFWSACCGRWTRSRTFRSPRTRFLPTALPRNRMPHESIG